VAGASATTLQEPTGLSMSQSKQYLVRLIGLSYIDGTHGISVRANESEMSAVLQGRLGERYLNRRHVGAVGNKAALTAADSSFTNSVSASEVT